MQVESWAEAGGPLSGLSAEERLAPLGGASIGGSPANGGFVNFSPSGGGGGVEDELLEP